MYLSLILILVLKLLNGKEGCSVINLCSVINFSKAYYTACLLTKKLHFILLQAKTYPGVCPVHNDGIINRFTIIGHFGEHSQCISPHKLPDQGQCQRLHTIVDVLAINTHQGEFQLTSKLYCIVAICCNTKYNVGKQCQMPLKGCNSQFSKGKTDKVITLGLPLQA